MMIMMTTLAPPPPRLLLFVGEHIIVLGLYKLLNYHYIKLSAKTVLTRSGITTMVADAAMLRGPAMLGGPTRLTIKIYCGQKFEIFAHKR